MEPDEFNPSRIKILNDSDTLVNASATKIYDIDTGKQLQVSNFNIYIKDGLLMADLQSFFTKLNVVCTVGSHIVRCGYCKNLQERINTKQIPDYACINYLDPLHDSGAMAGLFNCRYCERNSRAIFNTLLKQL